MVLSRPAWATQRDPVSKNKTKQKRKKEDIKSVVAQSCNYSIGDAEARGS
jgi:hypothetical protein